MQNSPSKKNTQLDSHRSETTNPFNQTFDTSRKGLVKSTGNNKKVAPIPEAKTDLMVASNVIKD